MSPVHLRRGSTPDPRAPTPPLGPVAGTLPERILDTAEALIRRYGPAKVTVVDVARSLRMSHGNVYRHFASKAALREAVIQRWLLAIDEEVAGATPAAGPAAGRLRAWVRALAAAKRARLQDDPELFAAYAALGDEQQGAVVRHLSGLCDQLTGLIADGVRAGEFAPRDPATAARALLDGTSAFHHPRRVPDTAGDPDGPARLEGILDLIVAGLTVAPKSGGPVGRTTHARTTSLHDRGAYECNAGPKDL